MMMSGRCLNHFRFHTSCQFQIYHKSSQQTISEKPILLCTDVYIFLQFCLKWLDKYLFRRTLTFFCSQSTSPATWSWGGFWNVNGYFSSGWSCIYPKGHCFDLDKGRQRKSLKRQQVITYCVVASVQVPVIAWPIKNGNNSSSFSLMDSEVIIAIWKRLVSQSVQKTI